MGTRIGSMRLIPGDQVLTQGSRFSGAIQVTLNERVTPKSLSVLLQSREQTKWIETRREYNYQKEKYETVYVDVGCSDVRNISQKQRIQGNFGGVQYVPGIYNFPFAIDIPTWLKPTMFIKSGEATATYGYQLRVSLDSNWGEHCSTLPLPGPRGINLPTIETERIDFFQRFRQIVKVKPLLREQGVVEVTASFDPDTVIPGESFQIILYLDNSGNPYDLTTGYLSLQQYVKFTGIENAKFNNTQIMQIKKLDCVPMPAGAFVQNLSFSFVANRYLPPSFYGNIIRTQYMLQLHLRSQYKLAREQTIVLSEVIILPRQGISACENKQEPLDENVTDEEINMRTFQYLWRGAALWIGFCLAKEVLSSLLNKIG